MGHRAEPRQTNQMQTRAVDLFGKAAERPAGAAVLSPLHDWVRWLAAAFSLPWSRQVELQGAQVIVPGSSTSSPTPLDWRTSPESEAEAVLVMVALAGAPPSPPPLLPLSEALEPVVDPHTGLLTLASRLPPRSSSSSRTC